MAGPSSTTGMSKLVSPAESIWLNSSPLIQTGGSSPALGLDSCFGSIIAAGSFAHLGHGHHEPAATIAVRLQPDPPAHGRHELPGGIQADPRAARPVGGPDVSLEHGGPFGLGNAGPVVGHVDLDFAVPLPGADAHGAAFGRVLHLVLEKMFQHLAEPAFLAHADERSLRPGTSQRV